MNGSPLGYEADPHVNPIFGVNVRVASVAKTTRLWDLSDQSGR